MKSKKFKVLSERIDIALNPPAPTSTSIPAWFKNIEPVRENDLTIKKCVPVLDAFTSGYVFKTSADVYYNDETATFSDNGVDKTVTSHMEYQIDGIEMNDDLTHYPYKWVNRFFVQTPPGYSTLFVHPLNRFDLPFQSISAVVDTDDFPLSVQFPFFMKKGFTGIIPAGTPVIQAIPFKRDDWKIDFPKQDKSYEYKDFYKWFDPPMAKYKRFFWKKKRYQ